MVRTPSPELRRSANRNSPTRVKAKSRGLLRDILQDLDCEVFFFRTGDFDSGQQCQQRIFSNLEALLGLQGSPVTETEIAEFLRLVSEKSEANRQALAELSREVREELEANQNGRARLSRVRHTQRAARMADTATTESQIRWEA
jgi:hypothetical protein